KGLAQDAQGAVVGVQGAIDDGSDDALGVVLAQGLFDDGLASAWLADDGAEPSLLAVDAQGVEHELLVRQQDQPLGREEVPGEAKVGADHDCTSPLDFLEGFRSLAMKSTGRDSPMRSPLKYTMARSNFWRSKPTWIFRFLRSRGASKRVFLREKVLSASTLRFCSTKNSSSLTSLGGRKRMRSRSRPKRSMGFMPREPCSRWWYSSSTQPVKARLSASRLDKSS